MVVLASVPPVIYLWRRFLHLQATPHLLSSWFPHTVVAQDGSLQFSGDAASKVKALRCRMFEGLAKLRNSGLPLQTALVLARLATAGDAVYASQCQVLSQQDSQQLDEITLNSFRSLLNVSSAEP